MTTLTMAFNLRRFWDENASNFDSLYAARTPFERTFNRLFRRAIFERVERTAAHILATKKPARVLDVGCGSGRTSIPLAEAGVGSVLGVDFAPRMIELARGAAAQAGVADRVEYEVADFTTHAFDGPFDFVVALGVFDYVSDAPPFLRRMLELAKHDVIFSVPKPSLLRAPLRRRRYGKHAVSVHFYDELAIRELTETAGATSVRIDRIPAGYLVIASK